MPEAIPSSLKMAPPAFCRKNSSRGPGKPIWKKNRPHPKDCGPPGDGSFWFGQE
jgi:hypothetical protein